MAAISSIIVLGTDMYHYVILAVVCIDQKIENNWFECRCFFFFKQKTASGMRISDWSSDVCSSDLDHLRGSEAFGRPFAPIMARDMGFAPGCRRMTAVDGAKPGSVAAPQRAQSPGQRMPVAIGQSAQQLHQRSIGPARLMSVTIAVSAKAAAGADPSKLSSMPSRPCARTAAAICPASGCSSSTRPPMSGRAGSEEHPSELQALMRNPY